MMNRLLIGSANRFLFRPLVASGEIKMKFKVGDRVRIKHKNHSPAEVGDLGTIEEIEEPEREYEHTYTVRMDKDGDFWFFDDHHLEPVITIPSALRQDAPTEGVKGDAGKADLSLLSSLWIFGVSDVLTYGSAKRGAHNWRKGLKITRVLAGVLRHVFQYLTGEDYDTDPNCPGCIQFKKDNSILCEKHSQKHHLLNASCGLMFAYELSVTRPDLDDRYKIQKENK
jgi:hypothetical protein